MVSRFLFITSLVAAAAAGPMFNSRNLISHESRSAPPVGFVQSGPAPSDQVLNLRVALKQNNLAGLEKALYDISSPESQNYRKFLSKEEVESYVKPSDETVAAVTSWLQSEGISAKTVSPAGDWLVFSVPVSKANDMFGTQFHVFTHEDTGKQTVRTLGYSIPAELQGHLDLVHPTITFESPYANLPVMTSPLHATAKAAFAQNSTASGSVPSSCANTVTPACLQDLYGIPKTKATESSNTLGVAGFLDEYANQADLAKFLKALRPDLTPAPTFSLQTLDDGSNSQSSRQAGEEAGLDVQYTVGVASGVPVTFISVGSDNDDGDLDGFLDIVNFILDESNPPNVLTTSYGQDEDSISQSLANNLCNAYMQLGARGTSVLFSSGDGGVSGSQSQSCGRSFIPTFPSGCPYLTSVGATTGIKPETAATFSSGGFSNYFDQPSYQSSAVSSYLSALGKTNSGKFNKIGRGFPDVSAQGQNVEIYYQGSSTTVSGTSCSSPIFASVIALINDRLIAAGQSPLGFLNPFLYSTGVSGLNDITSGSNPGCNTNGFPAKAGWDPVTGLGTPDFNKLLTAVGL